MKRLTTDNPQGNFETMLNYVYSKDGVAYIRSDGATDDVPLHEWAKRECIARGCDKSLGETMEEIDEAICDCAFDCPECPIFLAYTFACQACHLRDRLKRHEDAEADGRLVLLPCKAEDILYEIDLPEYGVITCKVISIYFHNGPMFHVPRNDVVSSLSVCVEVIEGHGKGSSYSFELEDFGKSVFLTQEDAEAALKGGAE